MTSLSDKRIIHNQSGLFQETSRLCNANSFVRNALSYERHNEQNNNLSLHHHHHHHHYLHNHNNNHIHNHHQEQQNHEQQKQQNAHCHHHNSHSHYKFSNYYKNENKIDIDNEKNSNQTRSTGAVERSRSSNVNKKKGIEILDFHESWLEQMAAYKGNNTKRFYQKLFNFQNIDKSSSSHRDKDSQNLPVRRNKSASSNVIRNAQHYENTYNELKSNSARVDLNLKSVEDLIIDKKCVNNQLSSKQAHEDIHSNTNSKSNNRFSKRSTYNRNKARGNTYTQMINNNVTPSSNANSMGNSIGSMGALTLNSSSTVSPHKSNMKIIVNQFHASSLLNSHEVDEKTKILTQNGLVTTSSAACEASFYAANYLANRQMMEYGKSGFDHLRNIRLSDDDPCTAIDDVTTYTDSDSEEDYKGEPFYLSEDNYHVLQSNDIHLPSHASIEEIEKSQDTLKSQIREYSKPTCILTPSLFPNVPPYLNFSSHVEKGPPMPQQLHRVLKWKLSPVMPKIVRRVVLNSGFRIIKNTMDWMAIWEKHMKSTGFRTIRSHQKYNHMPGSFRIGRKDTMWRSIYHNMKKFGKKEFGFMQKSYIMPDDLENLRRSWPKNASRLTKWIVKPPASARGTGIRIVNKWSQFPKDRPLVVQKYIERPLLINDNKFDMRLYVALTSINPIRLYLYKDGLARFASVKYSSELNSLDERCMHLTNYSINKFSQNYSKNEDVNACQGHKWTLQSLWSCLEARGINTKCLWATLRNLIIKSIISGETGLNRMYRQNVNFRYNCFELFGFDVLLDENLIPWLLEINISPSLHSELPLDLHVKGPLIQSILNTALYQVPPKLSEKQQKEILEELQLKGPLCHDKRIFTTCLAAEEVRKHNHYTNRSIEFREEYLDGILESLLPDDIRCLIVTEDELSRCQPMERIFPTPDTHIYLKFIENPRYYNRLLDAWENRYGHCRDEGIKLLCNLCSQKQHLSVPAAAMEKEPTVSITDIDMLHVKKSSDLNTGINLISIQKNSDSDTSSLNDNLDDKCGKNTDVPVIITSKVMKNDASTITTQSSTAIGSKTSTTQG